MTTPYATHTAGVAPGDTQQVSLQLEADATITGFVCDAGLQPVRFILGKHRVNADDEGKVESWGYKVNKKSFLIALLKNVTSAPIIGKGTFFLDGANLKPQQETAQVMSGVIPPKAAPVLATEPRRATPGVKKAPITSYPVGRNELAIAMTYGECRRLLEAVNGGMPIQGFERAAYLRRFNHALAIFQDQEIPAETPTVPVVTEASQEIDALKLRVAELMSELEEAKAKLEGVDEEGLKDRLAFAAGYDDAVEDLISFVNGKRATMEDKVKDAFKVIAKAAEERLTPKDPSTVSEEAPPTPFLEHAPSLPIPVVSKDADGVIHEWK